MIDNSYFLDEMKGLLNEDQYKSFLESIDNEMCKSIRVNTSKTDIDFLRQYINIGKQSCFDENTYLLESDDSKLGNHPFHIGGLYYLQEPSATIAVNALDVKEDDFILDLCSAPGGKSSQILNRLSSNGFLISNEYDKKRANTLLSNLERWGYDNYLLINSTVENLCPQLIGLVDKVLVDAPCSGASMFKKYPETVKDYNLNLELMCQKRQLNILDYAYLTLKKNGVLVYSTCTYNKYENEEVIEKFLATHPDMTLVDTGLSCGVKGFDSNGYTRRVFPCDEGEGHFVAKMIRNSDNSSRKLKELNFSSNKIVDKFIEENLEEKINYTIINDKVYGSNKKIKQLNGNVIRSGILMGQLVKNRFEPDHHLYLSQYKIKNCLNLDNFKDVCDFLSGNCLYIPGYNGYVQIKYGNRPFGFGKGDGKVIKNHLPKGLRVASASSLPQLSRF